MSNKVTEMTALAGANVDVAADLLPIIDVSEPDPADRNKSILIEELRVALALPYDVPLSYAGGPPTADEVLQAVVVPRQVEFAADFAGSAGYIDVNPTASFVISVTDDGVEIGTITVSTGGVFTFATTGGTAKTVAAGSLIEFVAPNTPDDTAAYILATLAGTL